MFRQSVGHQAKFSLHYNTVRTLDHHTKYRYCLEPLDHSKTAQIFAHYNYRHITSGCTFTDAVKFKLPWITVDDVIQEIHLVNNSEEIIAFDDLSISPREEYLLQSTFGQRYRIVGKGKI